MKGGGIQKKVGVMKFYKEFEKKGLKPKGVCEVFKGRFSKKEGAVKIL